MRTLMCGNIIFEAYLSWVFFKNKMSILAPSLKLAKTDLFAYCVYVQRKVRIGTIPELYLRIVRIPTLSADSGIVPDNSRIAQWVFYRFFAITRHCAM